MRVLYVSRGYTTHDRRFLARIAARHEVHFLPCERDHDRYEHRSLPDGVRTVPWEPSDEEMGPPQAMRAAPRFERTLREIRPDLIHAGPIQGCGLMAVFAGAHPLVLMSWGSDLLVDADRDEVWSWATRYALAHCDLLVCDSESVGLRARALAALPNERIVTFPWGIDLTAFAPGADRLRTRDRLGWNDALVVISTRSLEPLYGIDLVLEAFAQAWRHEPRLRLLLVGGGSLAPSIDRIVAQRGLGAVVDRTGPVSNDRLPDLFRAADLYVSAARSDGTSVSMLEAMATGLPVIVSDLAGNREWVRGRENGWLVADRDIDGFAAALLQAARLDRHDRARIGAINRGVVELRADQDVAFGPLLAAYERVGVRDAPQVVR